ncbi:MAG: hypothetical protein ABIT68_01835 [Sphingomicrobium sp.]
MRPITRTTLGALFAVAAAVSAPAPAASSDSYLTFGPVTGTQADARKGHDKWIEVESWSWGATQMGAGGHGGGSGGMGAAKAGGTGMGKGKASMSDLSVMRGPRQTTSLDGAQGATGAEKYGAVSGAHRDDSLARAVEPALAAPLGAPLERGSVRVKVKLPWLDCKVGAAFPDAVLHNDAGRYELKDAIVTSCSSGGDRPMESITLNYAKVQVRGWDPKKKEE